MIGFIIPIALLVVASVVCIVDYCCIKELERRGLTSKSISKALLEEE